MTRTLEQRFTEKYIPVTESGCWLWIAATSNGYGKFRIPENARELAHRVSWRLHKGEIPKGMFVCHSCDVRCCVNPDHLFLGTSQDNMIDAGRKGRLQWPAGQQRKFHLGEDNYAAKLKVENIHEIRKSSETCTALADKFNVSITTISQIRRRLKWRHIQ